MRKEKIIIVMVVVKEIKKGVISIHQTMQK